MTISDVLTNPLFLGVILPLLVGVVTKAGAGEHTKMIVAAVVASVFAVLKVVEDTGPITVENATVVATQIFVVGQAAYFLIDKVVGKYINEDGLNEILKPSIGVGFDPHVEGD